MNIFLQLCILIFVKRLVLWKALYKSPIIIIIIIIDEDEDERLYTDKQCWTDRVVYLELFLDWTIRVVSLNLFSLDQTDKVITLI